MEEKRFNIGDEVVMGDSSPVMIVREYVDSDSVQCEWFIKNELKTHTFKEA